MKDIVLEKLGLVIKNNTHKVKSGGGFKHSDLIKGLNHLDIIYNRFVYKRNILGNLQKVIWVMIKNKEIDKKENQKIKNEIYKKENEIMDELFVDYYSFFIFLKLLLDKIPLFIEIFLGNISDFGLSNKSFRNFVKILKIDTKNEFLEKFKISFKKELITFFSYVEYRNKLIEHNKIKPRTASYKTSSIAGFSFGEMYYSKLDDKTKKDVAKLKVRYNKLNITSSNEYYIIQTLFDNLLILDDGDGKFVINFINKYGLIKTPDVVETYKKISDLFLKLVSFVEENKNLIK